MTRVQMCPEAHSYVSEDAQRHRINLAHVPGTLLLLKDLEVRNYIKTFNI